VVPYRKSSLVVQTVETKDVAIGPKRYQITKDIAITQKTNQKIDGKIFSSSKTLH